jgi:hypothetical protein
MTDTIVLSRSWQADRYPVRCRGCGGTTELVLRWNSAGEVRKSWDGVDRARVNLRQPRVSTARCGACGSSDLLISPAEIT